MGPTASGKSAFGIKIAKTLDGVIINADTMQCYADLRIITARPSDEEMAQAEHRLYGIWSATTHGNAAMWLERAVEEIRRAHLFNKLPILLGGTGMYIKALVDGIADMPKIDPEIHARTKAIWEEDPVGFRDRLAVIDPVMARRLEQNDKQRLIRAMEVMEQTGVSLADWQEKPVITPFDKCQYHFTYTNVPRDLLYERIDARFDTMVEEGVLDEIRHLQTVLREALAQDESLEIEAVEAPSVKGVHSDKIRKKYNTLPLLRAHGVPEMLAYINDDSSLEVAIEKAKQNTRNYAKRQLTWIRNQLEGALPIPHDLLYDQEKTDAFIGRLAKTVDRPVLTY